MRRLTFLFLLLLGFGLLFGQGALQPEGAVRRNAPEHLDKPYVVLVSLDGFRWDYVQRFQPPNLARFIREGVAAEALLPCFPTKTFPNHYSIATGCYPEHHGLVGNSFYDPEMDAVYKISDRSKVEDGSWYGGTPLWVLAARHGMVSASFFFVGSEADVQGRRPGYYYRYDGGIPNAYRVEQILRWLKLPPETRPHLITSYFSDMDDVGHRTGPHDDAALREKLFALDATLGRLIEGIDSTGLPVNLLFVSDHGMAGVHVDSLLPLEAIRDDERYRTVNNGSMAFLYLRPGTDADAVLQELQSKARGWRVWKTAECPLFPGDRSNPRLGQLVVVAEQGHYFLPARLIALRRKAGRPVIGEHGFDPALRDMHGIFYARGPAFKKGSALPPFRNVHVYPLVAHILGLPLPEDIDGSLDTVRAALRNEGR